MHLPILKRENRYKRSVVNFGGLNLTQSFRDGELRECTGVSNGEFPFITQRKKRETEFECLSPSCAIFGENEFIAADDGLYYNRKKVGDLYPGKKYLAALGECVAVFPDKMYYNIKTEKFASLCNERQTEGATVTFTTDSISVASDYFVQESFFDSTKFQPEALIVTYEKANVSEGKVQLSGFALKKPDEISAGTVVYEKCKPNQYRIVQNVSYSEEENCYEVMNDLITVKNVTENFFDDFKEGDTLEVEGCTSVQDNNKTFIVLAKESGKLTVPEGTFIPGTETENITIRRKIPDFTSVCVYENRLWGFVENTIYASALGDMTSFFTYQGISTDSYSVQSNSAGDFTACVPYGNSCFFFKETSCYKLYGNRPANFKLTECFGPGILKGDSESIVQVGGRLLYKGNGGIYSFYGSTAVRISDKLGIMKMENATGGTDGKLYYLSVNTENGREEFVWDTENDLWCKSGVTDIIGYATYGDDVYCLKPGGIEKISDKTDENAQWSITLCPFDEKYYKTKNYSRLHIKAQLFEGAYIGAAVKYDSGNWENIGIFYGDSKKYLNIPFTVKSCHELNIRIWGKGRSILESLVREFSIN